LGRLRFAVLLSAGNGKEDDDEFCLIGIKEATSPPRHMRFARLCRKMMRNEWLKEPSTYPQP
jgi:hypothetical protein